MRLLDICYCDDVGQNADTGCDAPVGRRTTLCATSFPLVLTGFVFVALTGVEEEASLLLEATLLNDGNEPAMVMDRLAAMVQMPRQGLVASCVFHVHGSEVMREGVLELRVSGGGVPLLGTLRMPVSSQSA
jgi:hypothetical protein